MSDPFYKRQVQDRHSSTKAFSYDSSGADVVGKTNQMNLESYPNYNMSAGLNDSCLKYASAYTETMLTRAQVEDPEIFAKKGMNKHEM